MDLIDRQAAIDEIAFSKEMLNRVLDDMDVVGVDREKYEWGLGLIESLIDDIRELPSARPERKTGRWIVKTVNMFEMAYGSTGYEPVYECSLCGGVEESYLRFDEPIMPEDADFPNYCPNCGASMVRGEEDE